MASARPPAKRRRPLRPTPKPKAAKAVATKPPVAAEDVALVRTKGSPGRGGGPGGEVWRLEVDGKRVGVVFLNLIDEMPIGRHASIQIYLNASSQGRKIGRVAYRKACEASSYNLVYAHMRKSNIASWRAAEEAGFVDATPSGERQKVMVWCRPSV